MKRVLHTPFVLALLLIGALLGASCGDSDSNIFAVINNKQVNLPVDGTDIVISGLGGQVILGPNGVPIAGKSLSILIRFINGNILDMIRFDIKDVTPIVLGQTVYVDGGNITATLQLSGVEQYITQGVIKFNELGIADGQTVSGDFQISSAVAQMQGHFEGEAKLAF